MAARGVSHFVRKGETLLVLSVTEGDVIEIGGGVRLHIRRVRGRWVRVCVDAPREVDVERVAGVDGVAAGPPDELRTRTRRGPR